MKKITQITLIFLFVIGNMFAQQEKGIIGINNWLTNWTEFKPNQKDYGEATQILTGDITQDTKLSKKYVYLLLGSVFVANNATLTIEPGTVIIGDYATRASLTISKGSKIIADGTETDPIIFTSNRSLKREGDWGGLIVLGDAPTNKFGNGSVAQYYPQLPASAYSNTNFGGENLKSNSGILKYVRIEYAGKRISRGLYFSGLLLAGVGNETTLESIMVSFSAGNSIEIWGGEMSLTNAVSYKTSGNDYKFNYGAQCNFENSLAIRSPYISSSTGSRCMQVVSYDNREEVDFSKKGTSVVAKNLTLVSRSEDFKADLEKGLIKEALFVGQNAALDMSKTVISGFNPAVLFDDMIEVNQANLEKIKFKEMYFNNCNGNIFIENNYNNEDLENWYGNTAFFNVYSKGKDVETFIEVNNDKKADYRLRINKIIAINEVDVDD